MHLKRLDIQGFKSFSDKTTLDFNLGITSIVGPNGCGKSNIADAIRWVLGEQSMKAIRGTKLEDIIFVGTEFRKPVGFAEVSLTLDNSDNALPLDYSEVTISRRFFRSGESEYFINKTPCRLKDIYNLFLDTGIGKDGYSIISQGKIDDILSTKSEDRRTVFEEASGIMKFKVRKEEAERKLELTKQNLIRINDILNELFSHLEPLKEQSAIAKKYLSLRDELKILEINVYIDLITRLKERLKEHDELYNLNLKSKNDLVSKIENISKDKHNFTLYLKDIEEKLDASKREFYSFETNLEKSLGELNLNNEKINSLSQSISRLNGELLTLSNSNDVVEESILKNKNKLNKLNIEQEKLIEALKATEIKREDILLNLDKHEKYLEQMKSTLMDKYDLLSDKKIQVVNISNQIENLHKQKTAWEKEISEISSNIIQETEKKGVIECNIDNIVKKLDSISKSLKSLIDERRQLDLLLTSEKEKKNRMNSDLQVKSSKYNMLQSMENNLEGYNRTVKNFLQECRKGGFLTKGIKGALGQLISVKEQYSTAIEIALGGVIQNIVTETEEDAKAAINFLKKKNMGRATFLPISSVKGSYLNKDIVDQAKKCDGFCGVASDLIDYHSDYTGIILNFLGRVVIVRDLNAGIDMARKFRYSFRIVTLDGDMLSTTGAISGGSNDVYISGILSRANQITELAQEIDNLKDGLTNVEGNILSTTNDLEKTSKQISDLQSFQREKELLRLKEENILSNTIKHLKNITAKEEMLKQEISQLLKLEVEITTDLGKYKDEQIEIEESIAKLKDDIDKYNETQKEKIYSRDSILNEITNHKIAINSIMAEINVVKNDIEKSRKEKEFISSEISDKKNEIFKIEDQIKDLKDKNIALNKLIKNYQEEKTGKNVIINRLNEEIKTYEEDLQKAVTELEDANNNISLLNEDLNRIAIKKAKAESELDNIQNRLWDEYELTYNNALIHKKDIGSVQKAQKEILQLKDKIKELGAVNVSAIEDYVRTKERYEFMNTQKIDLEEASEKLKKIILEMNVLMEKQFNESFNLINENFNLVFNELFGGGKANLRLVDKNNVLESGIEIEVQPPGKKLQNMMLLSGGERAFTAIALLFSILLLKPVSFCVLDEIEASLDDANVARFAAYLKKLSKKTQFIVITHRKGTMEAADTLYGVTMQEKGISKVVSMKI